MSIAGRFVWYELLARDPEAAKAFYRAVMGWRTQPWEQGSEPYSLWLAGETPIGGVMKILPEWERAGERPRWWAHVAVGDVDAAARRTTELGGRIETPPTDIPEVGRFAIVADPHGAVVSLFRSTRGEAPPFDRAKPGVVGWHELYTTDNEAAWRFYAALFGWERTSALDMGEWGSYLMFRHPDDPENASMGGMFNAAKQMSVPPHWLYYVNVEEMDAALGRVAANGGRVAHGPVDVPGGGRAAQCLDPEGARFAMFAFK